MTTWVALIRAVNVGGTGKLPMATLTAMCRDAGFESPRTYIASGDVVFSSRLPEDGVKRALEKRLAAYAGKPVGVLVRSSRELAAVLDANPFRDAAPNRTLVTFLDEAPPTDAIAHAKNVRDERIALGRREIYVAYGDGMGNSRLKIPAAETGTARNMNTVARLVEMAGEG